MSSDDPLPPDDVLIARLRGRDEASVRAALDYLVRRDAAARGVVRHEQRSADEVVQDTWLAVIQNIDRFEGRSSLKHWVYRIVANTAKRRAARESRAVPSGDMGPDDEPTVDPARFRGSRPALSRALAGPAGAVAVPRRRGTVCGGTPSRRRPRSTVCRRTAAAVITLRDIEGYTAEETCALLDITPANQRVLLHRGRAAVRAELEKYLVIRCNGSASRDSGQS